MVNKSPVATQGQPVSRDVWVVVHFRFRLPADLAERGAQDQ
jgi:hypothetical protein